MFIYDTVFENERQTRDFVMEAEKKYKDQVLHVAKQIAKLPNIKFLTLAGPTCSGKTTTSYILEQELARLGLTVKIISIDDFYRNRDDIFEDEKPDYESISALDFDVFVDCVGKILDGKTVMLPKFDFRSGHRAGYETYTPQANEIVIFEGIQAIYPEIVATIPADTARSIYINAADDVTAYGVFFAGREVRFLRRLVRDYLFRGASAARTLELWEGVVANEDKNIIPYGKNADFIINSFLTYELNVIKPYLLDVIKYCDETPCEVELLATLREKFRQIPEIPSSFVPSDSVFREFIGNSAG